MSETLLRIQYKPIILVSPTRHQPERREKGWTGGEVFVLVIDDWELSIEGLKDWAVFKLFEGVFFLLAGTQVIS